MFERDHLMRQISLLSQALSRALVHRAEGRDGEAIKVLDAALEECTGGGAPGSPESDDLLRACSDNEGAIQPFAFDIATILATRGDIQAEGGRMTRAAADYEQAMAIYRMALERGATSLPYDIAERIDLLRERLQDLGRDDSEALP